MSGPPSLCRLTEDPVVLLSRASHEKQKLLRGSEGPKVFPHRFMTVLIGDKIFDIILSCILQYNIFTFILFFCHISTDSHLRRRSSALASARSSRRRFISAGIRRTPPTYVNRGVNDRSRPFIWLGVRLFLVGATHPLKGVQISKECHSHHVLYKLFLEVSVQTVHPIPWHSRRLPSP